MLTASVASAQRWVSVTAYEQNHYQTAQCDSDLIVYYSVYAISSPNSSAYAAFFKDGGECFDATDNEYKSGVVEWCNSVIIYATCSGDGYAYAEACW